MVKSAPILLFWPLISVLPSAGCAKQTFNPTSIGSRPRRTEWERWVHARESWRRFYLGFFNNNPGISGPLTGFADSHNSKCNTVFSDCEFRGVALSLSGSFVCINPLIHEEQAELEAQCKPIYSRTKRNRNILLHNYTLTQYQSNINIVEMELFVLRLCHLWTVWCQWADPLSPPGTLYRLWNR